MFLFIFVSDLQQRYRFTEQLENDLHHSIDLSKGNILLNINKSQYTWSPCDLTNYMPNSELERLPGRSYRRGRKSLNFTFPWQGADRNLSELFSPAGSARSDHVNDQNAEPNAMTRSVSSHTKTFFVTPCTSDPLKDNV